MDTHQKNSAIPIRMNESDRVKVSFIRYVIEVWHVRSAISRLRNLIGQYLINYFFEKGHFHKRKNSRMFCEISKCLKKGGQGEGSIRPREVVGEG